jgi:hypothetical protein
MMNIQPQRPAIPASVLTYGVLGLIPFLAPPLAGLTFPGLKPASGLVLAVYGGLILSFLGGARWGLAIRSPSPNVLTVSVAMVPTLAALALLVAMPGHPGLRLVGLAGALVVHWLWDLGSDGLPPWYPALRTMLTAGAVAGLLLGAAVLA